ncbi:heavy-metal-associated domain-containing protein [Lactococcus allomyrinae]|uniref:Heavy-metal-associated domain-containing protein n=1 Tax=Lactococcus allomyrinae TaxID=2419773 RepID=A0A387BF05_9LACT|nr:heavy metal-associated domain-containing protein [Lactococcus allomyrinae]AYG00662.1 heavy-metal-associated domain-containing protein [Lactococcus allomyrinae]
MTEINDATTGPTIREVGDTAISAHTTVNIEGMTCTHCANTVAQAIFDVPGIIAVKVFLEEGKAMFDTNAEVSLTDISFSVEKAGYKLVL